MIRIRKKLFSFILCQFVLVVTINAESTGPRDFGGHLLNENTQDYHLIQYPDNYYSTTNDYSGYYDSRLQTLLGRGLSILMLKMGFVKAVIVLLFLGFFIKLPFLMLKVIFLKSLILPFLVAPLLYQLYVNNSNQSENTTTSKPNENLKPDVEDAFNAGRYLDEGPFSLALKSVKMFAESEQCMERIYCVLGASNNDSFTGNIFSRVFQFIEHTSPPGVKERMSLIAKAYNKGRRSATCSVDEYKCQTPEILIRQEIGNSGA